MDIQRCKFTRRQEKQDYSCLKDSDLMQQDHRQTRPFVASDDVRDNPWVPQMLVSMMERADRAGAVPHSLLINHRAYGGLQQLASNMFYKKKMISGHTDDKLFPPSVQHLQRYLERFLDPGQTCREPRLIVFSPRRSEVKVGTSWFNEDHVSIPCPLCSGCSRTYHFATCSRRLTGVRDAGSWTE